MSASRLVVIGTSAGGVQALKELFHNLPRDLPAAVGVVMHLHPSYDSNLPTILNFNGTLSAHHAVSGEAIKDGTAFIAPPNRHVLVEDGVVVLSTAPRENRNRPAIDPLFRSAAAAYGPRTIGVILTGALDDGTAGLWEIKQRGGIAVVQSPEDAAHPGMPTSAIENVAVDYTLALREIPELIVSLCTPGVTR